MKYKNVGNHPVELAGGQMIGPGEEVDLDSEAEEHEENKVYIDEGTFLALEESSGKSKSSTKSKEG